MTKVQSFRPGGSLFFLCSVLLCCSYFVKSVDARIYSASNVPVGQLPPPLANMFANYHMIQIGTGSAGSLSATLLAQSRCLRILVLDDGFPVQFNDTTNGIIPGMEYQGGYFNPGLEKEALQVPNSVINAEHNGYGALWRKITGGDQRLSHYAIEMGDVNDHRKYMYEPLGSPPDWSPEYVWGHVVNKVFNFSGPNIQNNHANQGRIRVQQSRDSAWQESAVDSCVAVTGNTPTYDFNTINGGYRTCGAEPSNVKTNGLRSITENEYLLPEAAVNPNLDFVRDCKISRILFQQSNPLSTPVAVGVEGTFRSQVFSIRFPYVIPGQGNHHDEGSMPRLSEKDLGPIPVVVPPGTDCPAHTKNVHHDNMIFNTQSAPGAPLPILRRVILLSTGTINNPQLLKLSGVGPRAELQKWNIPVYADLPAVGEYLKEGTVAFFGYFTNATAAEIGVSASNSDLITSRPGGFVSVDATDNMLWLMTPSNWGTLEFPFVVGYALTFEMTQERNGSVKLITSNAADYPRVDYGWNEDTMQKQIKFLKKARDIVYQGGIADRFAFYQYFPAAAAGVSANNKNQRQQQKYPAWPTHVMQKAGHVLLQVAKMIQYADLSTPESRVKTIKSAVRVLENSALASHVAAKNDLTRAAWTIMWQRFMSEQSNGRLPLRGMAMSVSSPAFSGYTPLSQLQSWVDETISIVFGQNTRRNRVSSKTALNNDAVEYDDDAVLREAVATGAQAILHASGTARMTKNDSIYGVVNTNFDVYKVAGLKVGDMSILPYFPGAGGQSWAYITAFNVQNVIRDLYGIPRL